MVEFDLTQIGLEVGGATVIGALIGFTAKKVAKLIALIIGAELVLFKFLESRDILVVNWDKITGAAENASAAATAQTPPSWVETLLSTLSVGAGFSVGFLVGFKKA